MPGQVYVEQVADLPRDAKMGGRYQRTGVVMDAANLSFVWLTPDAFEEYVDAEGLAPGHAHPFDQLVYVIEGHLRFWTGEQVHDLGPGDVCYVPRDVPHGGRPLNDEPVRLLEVFAPIRTDYLYTAEHQLSAGKAPRMPDGSRFEDRSLYEPGVTVSDSTFVERSART